MIENSEFKYVLSAELKESLLVAQITKRPLLIKGEPGTGKTLLALHVAKEQKRPLYQWHVKSTTVAKDGLYFYDAVTRLNDSRFSHIDSQTQVRNIENYIRLEPVGQAFLSDEPTVLLIDEIDKADIEFPNDLLQELDRMEFTINETGKTVKAKHRPLVIITSNNEKELPDAFLRRCIFHYIEFPDFEMMQKIVKAHFPDIEKKILLKAMEVFYSLRNMEELKKRPSTSELIDWINILLHQGAQMPSEKNIPYLGTLIKSEEDLSRFRQ